MELEKLIAAVLSIAIAIAYLIGYAFLDGYYEYFDVSLAQLNFGIQYILTHSIVPLRSFFSPRSFAIVVIVIFILSYAFGFLRDGRASAAPSDIAKILRNFTIALATILGIFVAFTAHEKGLQRASVDFAKLNRATIDGGGASDYVNAYLKRNAGTRLHYLISANGYTFLVVKFPLSDRRWVYRVLEDDYEVLKVYQNVIKVSG